VLVRPLHKCQVSFTMLIFFFFFPKDIIFFLFFFFTNYFFFIFFLFFFKYNSNQLQQKRKNTTRGPGQPKIETKNESTRRQCFRRCGPISSRHGCHKAGVTIKGDFKCVLSHNDPNTQTGVNKGRGEQQKSP
jgi:hypothetical protein